MRNNPYIGPRPYERPDRDKFFGRARETRDLLSLIMAERVVLFYAQSGAGKTSLLNTQIIPALEEEGFAVLPVVRVGSDLPPGLPARVVKNIFVFSVWMGLMGKETPLATISGNNLLAAVNSWLVNAPLDENGEPRPPILIIDQFEEILTTHRDRWQDAKGFFEQLADALNRTPKLGVVLAMREDHVAGLDPYAPLLPKRLKARFRMERLGYDGALEAIKKPAASAGVPFGLDVAEQLADDLRRIKAAHFDGRAEDIVLGPYVEPVQLQVVCSQLWENLPDQEDRRIDAEDVQQYGNVDRALIGFYESAIHQVLDQAKANAIPVRERQLREWFGTRLITPERTRGLTIRGAKDTTDDIPNAVVDMLEGRHIIRADVRAGARWYEIAHDRLVEPILSSNAEWEATSQSPLHRAALRWSAAGENPDLLYRGQVLKQALAWAEANRNDCERLDLDFLEKSKKAQAAAEKELRQYRLIRRLAVAALVALIVATAAGIFAFSERNRAEAQRQIAVSNQHEAETQRASAVASQAEAEKQRAAAVASQAEAEKQRNDATRFALLAIVRQLISQASDFAASYPQRSLLLVMEALRLNNNTDTTLARAAEDQLRQVLVTAGGVVLQRYGNRVNQVVFSPTGRRMLAVSEDGHADVWDTSSTATLPAAPLELLAQGPAVRVGALSADDRWAAAGDAAGKVYLWDLRSAAEPAQPIELGAHSGAVRDLEFSPDGRWLISGGADGSALVWDLSSNFKAVPPVRLSAHQGGVNTLAIDSGSALLATGGADNLIKIYQLGDLSAAPITLTGHTDQVDTLAFDPLGQYLASGSVDATARLWDLTAKPNSPKAMLILLGHAEQVSRVAFSTDGHWLATGSVDTTARLWNMENADPSQDPIVLLGHNDQIYDLTFGPNDRWLFTGSRDSTIRAWDTSAPDVTAASAQHVLRGHEGAVETLAAQPSGHWLVSGSDDGTVRVWGINSPELAAAPTVLRGHTAVVRGALIDPAMKWLATYSGDGDVRLWDISSSEPGANSIRLPSHNQAIYSAALSPDGRWLATASQDNTSRLWDLRPPSGVYTSTVLRGHTSALRAVAFTPDSKRLVTGSRDGTARIWDVTKPDPAQDPIVLRGHTNQIRVLDISPNGHWLITGGDDGTPRLWDLTSTNIPSSSLQLKAHKGAIRAVDFSSDNRWVATGGDDQVVRVWDLKATDPTTNSIPLQGHTGTIRAVRFTPDGKWLVTAGADDAILLWNMATLTDTTPKPAFRLTDHQGEVRAIDVSADSHWLLSGSEDGTARLWDLAAPDPGAKSLVFPGHNGPVWGVTISPNGEWFATASQDANARLWRPTSLAEALQAACSVAGRNLSANEWTYYVGGDVSQNYHSTCPDFSPGAGVK